MGWREHISAWQHQDPLNVSGWGHPEGHCAVSPKGAAVGWLHSPRLRPFQLFYSISCAHGVTSPTKVLGSCRGREVAKSHSPLCLVMPSGQGGWWELESSVSPIAPDQAVRGPLLMFM